MLTLACFMSCVKDFMANIFVKKKQKGTTKLQILLIVIWEVFYSYILSKEVKSCVGFTILHCTVFRKYFHILLRCEFMMMKIIIRIDCLCGITDRQKTRSLISSLDYCQSFTIANLLHDKSCI